MEHKFFHLIPDEILQAWKSGEYFTGRIPSEAYTRIGLTLQLRGWYIYEAKTKGQLQYKGISLIDLKEGTLFIGGIRLYDKEKKNIYPVWGSEFSHFVGDSEVVWIYKVFTGDDVRSLAEEYINKKILEFAIDGKQAEFVFPEDEWNKLLDALRNHFYDDFKKLERNLSENFIRGCLNVKYHLNKGNEPLTGVYGQVGRPDVAVELHAGTITLTRAHKK